MNQDDMYSLLRIFSPFITFFLLKVINFRAERVVSEFHFALQEKYPRSFVKQRKIVKTVRKFSGMDTKQKIHWMFCLGNYLQFIVIIFPLIMFLLHLMFGIDRIAFRILNFCIIVIGSWALLISFFVLFLCFRCKRIKKKNPKYSKCELRDWHG